MSSLYLLSLREDRHLTSFKLRPFPTFSLPSYSSAQHRSHWVGKAVMQSRAYQVEMFEESLKGNRIICMSTGSGKTHVAMLRIEAELKKSPNKIVWFLTPNVALSQQQHTYLSMHLPAHRFRIITSLDVVDNWSTQENWEAALCSNDFEVRTPHPLILAIRKGYLRHRERNSTHHHTSHQHTSPITYSA